MKGLTDHEAVSEITDEEIRKQVENDPDSYLPSEEELRNFSPVNKDGDHE